MGNQRHLAPHNFVGNFWHIFETKFFLKML